MMRTVESLASNIQRFLISNLILMDSTQSDAVQPRCKTTEKGSAHFGKLRYKGDGIEYLDTLLTLELQHNHNIKSACITD